MCFPGSRRERLGYTGNKDGFSVTLRRDREEEISEKKKEDKIKEVGANLLEKNGDRRKVLGIELCLCFLF